MSKQISLSDVMEFLVANAAPRVPSSALAGVCDRLIWCVADNGGEIAAVRDRWLQGDDRQRAEIALAMDETFPMNGGDAMLAVPRSSPSGTTNAGDGHCRAHGYPAQPPVHASEQ